MTVRLLTGDCRAMLATLPDASVQLCVTSPPYLGLRDYGTASWQGGDAACDHVERTLKPSQRSTLEDHGPDGRSPQLDALPGIPYRDTCGKCGATRVDQQIGLEPTVEAYVAKLVAVFRDVRRVLRDDGVLFLNLGDSYAGGGGGNYGGQSKSTATHGDHITNVRNRDGWLSSNGLKPKDLIGIPWRVAFALQADGWYLRSDIIWAKPNPMPESVRDRPTKSHECVFLLTKSPRYFWDAEAVKEPSQEIVSGGQQAGLDKLNRTPGRTPLGAPRLGRENADPSGRNIRSVWTIATAPFAEAHFATFPPALAERCIKAGTSEKGACSACGAPWVRTTERGDPVQQHWAPGTQEKVHVAQGKHGATSVMNTGFVSPRETTGWQPTCPCDVPIVPCVVLDPFGGAGTVSLVAERLGRDSIYIDLSPEYAAMARKRITGEAPMFAAVQST